MFRHVFYENVAIKNYRFVKPLLAPLQLIRETRACKRGALQARHVALTAVIEVVDFRVGDRLQHPARRFTDSLQFRQFKVKASSPHGQPLVACDCLWKLLRTPRA